MNDEWMNGRGRGTVGIFWSNELEFFLELHWFNWHPPTLYIGTVSSPLHPRFSNGTFSFI